jgi:hypothetical protein
MNYNTPSNTHTPHTHTLAPHHPPYTPTHHTHTRTPYTHTHPTPYTHTLYASKAVAPEELRAEERPDLSAALLLELKREGFEAFSARTAALPYGMREEKREEKEGGEKREVRKESEKKMMRDEDIERRRLNNEKVSWEQNGRTK